MKTNEDSLMDENKSGDSQLRRTMPLIPSSKKKIQIKPPRIMLRVRFLMKLLDKTIEELFHILKITKEDRLIQELLADLYRNYIDEIEEPKTNLIEKDSNISLLIELLSENQILQPIQSNQGEQDSKYPNYTCQRNKYITEEQDKPQQMDVQVKPHEIGYSIKKQEEAKLEKEERENEDPERNLGYDEKEKLKRKRKKQANQHKTPEKKKRHLDEISLEIQKTEVKELSESKYAELREFYRAENEQIQNSQLNLIQLKQQNDLKEIKEQDMLAQKVVQNDCQQMEVQKQSQVIITSKQSQIDEINQIHQRQPQQQMNEKEIKSKFHYSQFQKINKECGIQEEVVEKYEKLDCSQQFQQECKVDQILKYDGIGLFETGEYVISQKERLISPVKNQTQNQTFSFQQEGGLESVLRVDVTYMTQESYVLSKEMIPYGEVKEFGEQPKQKKVRKRKENGGKKGEDNENKEVKEVKKQRIQKVFKRLTLFLEDEKEEYRERRS